MNGTGASWCTGLNAGDTATSMVRNLFTYQYTVSSDTYTSVRSNISSVVVWVSKNMHKTFLVQLVCRAFIRQSQTNQKYRRHQWIQPTCTAKPTPLLICLIFIIRHKSSSRSLLKLWNLKVDIFYNTQMIFTKHTRSFLHLKYNEYFEKSHGFHCSEK